MEEGIDEILMESKDDGYICCGFCLHVQVKREEALKLISLATNGFRLPIQVNRPAACCLYMETTKLRNKTLL